MFLDYSNCIANLACSILKYYGADYTHDTLKYMDDLLQDSYKNVVVMLFDGLGTDALRAHLPENSFLREHMLGEYYSVFPPTTTAATTTLESGLMPAEHGWLGWSLYFSELDKTVNAFNNIEQDSDIMAADYSVAGRYIPYKSIYEKIEEAGRAKAYSVSKFGSNRIHNKKGFYEEIKKLCEEKGNKYIYAYWEEPDSIMHEDGCYAKSVTDIIQKIEKEVKELCSQLEDTLVIVTADHGHANLINYRLSDYPDLLSMLKRPSSIEARAAAFHVKEEYKEAFPVRFKEIFGDEFLLLSKEQVIKENIFGPGKIHPKFPEFIGDYLAMAIKDKGIVNSIYSNAFKSNHAGMTEKEMKIPFIAISMKKNRENFNKN